MQLATTNCYPVFNQVHCDTYGSTPPPAAAPAPAGPDYGALLNQPNPGQTFSDAFERARALKLQQEQIEAENAQGAANRRAAAYAKVGDLIASGDCAGAKRLAQFYNHPDIIADTAKACP